MKHFKDKFEEKEIETGRKSVLTLQSPGKKKGRRMWGGKKKKSIGVQTGDAGLTLKLS